MSPRARSARPARSTAEQVSFAVASAVVLAIAVAIAVLGARDTRPPELTVSVVGEPRTRGASTYVTADVRNSGRTAAEEVQVVAELLEGGEATPVGEQVVSFLAGGATSTVVFVLSEADLSGLSVRVQSYTESG